MQTMLTLFPNLKLVYFSSRVYAGYSNGVGTPDNPEPYAYEVGFAVKWAIGDQLNGNANSERQPDFGTDRSAVDVVGNLLLVERYVRPQ